MPTWLRVVLTVTRSIVLLLLVFIIFEATLNFLFQKENPPILAVAVDNSASMTITDSDGSRQDILKGVLTDDVFDELAKNFDIKFYTLSNNVELYSPNRGDSLSFLGDATNIRQGLEKIKTDNVVDNLTNILLISDGNYNEGGNPVRFADELGVPIHTIGVGSADPVTDVAIANVEANPFTYADQSTPVQVTVRNSGFDKLSIPVELRRDDAILTRQTIELGPSPSEQTITLDFTPTDIGRQKLTVGVPQQAGERIVENNSRSFYIDVFKSKLQILLIAGSVSPDISFMKRILQNDRYDISSLIHKQNGQFYEKMPASNELGEVDVFIFLDFPMRGVNQAFLQNLLAAIQAKKQPILYILGLNTSLAEAEKFSEFIPLQNAGMLSKSLEVSVQLSPLGANHPIMQVSQDPVTSQSIWQQVPPVFSPLIVRQLAPGSEVLAYAQAEQQQNRLLPLIAIRTNGAHKSAALFADQLWRWDFMMRGINRSEDVYSRLLQNLIRWFETNRSESLVRVTMDKTQYHFGDPIDIKIDVFDENLNPVDKADVRVSLKSGQANEEFAAQSQGNGKYHTLLQAPQPNDYQAVVSARIDGRQLGEETVLFSVGEYSAELTDIQAQPMVLQSLSRVTGGQFVPADSTQKLLGNIHGEKTITPLNIENELWNNKIILVLILFLLTLEWFIRKRRGMV